MKNEKEYWSGGRTQLDSVSFVTDTINEINRLTVLTNSMRRVLEDLSRKVSEVKEKFGTFESHEWDG